MVKNNFQMDKWLKNLDQIYGKIIALSAHLEVVR